MGDGATIIETSVLKITPRTSTYNFPRIPTGRNEREDKTIRKEFVRFFFSLFFFEDIWVFLFPVCFFTRSWWYGKAVHRERSFGSGSCHHTRHDVGAGE